MKRIFTLVFAMLAVAAAVSTVPAAEYDRYERGYPPSAPPPPPRGTYARPPQHAVYGQTYLVFHGGVFEPNDFSDGLTGYDQGWNFDLGIGSRVSPILAVEGLVGAYGADRGSDEVRVVPVTIGARLVLPNPVIEPYLGGGIGIYFAKLKEGPSPVARGLVDFQGIDDSDTTVGGYVSLGLDAWLNPRTALNLEGKYHIAVPTFRENVFSTPIDVDVSGWAVNLGIRLAF